MIVLSIALARISQHLYELVCWEGVKVVMSVFRLYSLRKWLQRPRVRMNGNDTALIIQVTCFPSSPFIYNG